MELDKMDLETMYRRCVEAEAAAVGVLDGGYVIWRLSRAARGARIRLSPRSGPLGEVLQAGRDYTVASFSAREVLTWLNFKGGGRG